MPGFFEAAKNWKPIKKKHTVTIEGRTVEVSLEQKLEIKNLGESEWTWQDNTIVRKPKKKKTQRKFAELTKNVRGYCFLNADPYWPTEIVEGGYTWQTPSE